MPTFANLAIVAAAAFAAPLALGLAPALGLAARSCCWLLAATSEAAQQAPSPSRSASQAA